MRTLSGLFLLVLLLAPLSVSAQDDEWPSIDYLRNDYREVQTVAHVSVEKAVIVRTIGGYENWRVTGKVAEVFKGKLNKGATLEYYHGAEAGFREEMFLGEKIVFLLAEHDKEKKQQVYTVLENSTLPHNADRVRKLRSIRSSFRRKTPHR